MAQSPAIPLSLLIVADSPDDARLFVRELEAAGYAPTAACVNAEADLRAALAGAPPDAVIVACPLAELDCPSILAALHASRLDLPCIAVSPAGDEAAAAAALHAGAHDCIERDRLAPVLARELRAAAERRGRAAAEAALREAERRLHFVSETVSDDFFTFRVRPDGSPEADWQIGDDLRISGYSSRELQAMGNWLATIHPADQPHVHELLGHLLVTEGRRTAEMRIVTKTGDERWVHVVARSEFDPQERRVTHVYIAVQNITERRLAEDRVRAAEAALRQSDQFNRQIIFSARQGIIVYDRDLRYVLWNPFMEELTGLTADQVRGRSALELFPHLREQGIDALLRRALAGETVSADNMHFSVPSTGRSGWTQGTYSPHRDAQGEIIGVVGIVHDITARRQAEEALHQSQKLESLGLLAGGIAHDFNNLLVALLGQISLALLQLPPRSPVRGNLDKALAAAKHAADLTRQMLAYSGRGQFQVRAVDINILINENLDLFKTALPKHVTFQTRLHDPLPPIEGDPGQLQQIIMNLLINAAEAIGERAGTVDVTTSVETVAPGDARWLQPTGEFLPPGDYTLLSVRDDGSGMDEATRARIFDPFFSTKITGRGLGLSAVLGIVRGHQGGLHVDSAPGRGSTFTLLFPARAHAGAPPAPVAEARPELPAEGVVLIIDDEEAVRRAVADILELHGLPTLVADGGSAGLAVYREHQADIRLVLLDLSMPGLSGEETFRALREINSAVRVVLSSGYQEGEAARHFAAGDLVGFLQKPYDSATLLAAVRRYMG